MRGGVGLSTKDRRAPPGNECQGTAVHAGGARGCVREGLAIEVRPTNQTFPLTFEIELTSDPKCLEDYPKAGQFAYRATARLDAAGTLVVAGLRARARRCGM